jgi:hypothetical protein
MKIRGIDDCGIDEALWGAYRCHDKSAVTENLLRRYLPKLTLVPNVRGLVTRFANRSKLPRTRSKRCVRKNFNRTGHTQEELRHLDDVWKHFHATGRTLGVALVDEVMFS